MMLPILVLAASLAAPQAAAPEFKPSVNPVADAARQSLAQHSKNLVAAAELMPADKYGYQPTEAQMTFGKLVAHIVQTNTIICSMIGGLPVSPDVMKPADAPAPKDALVAAMKQSFAVCTEALAKTTDAQLGDELTLMGRRSGQSRAAAVITITSDWADHYSTAASYLRLNGILPPTAQPKK